MNPLLVPAKLNLICGAPGVRKDFVAGWLSKCTGFVDTYWRVDPVDGHSELVSGGNYIEDIFTQIRTGSIIPDAQSPKTLALACHPDIVAHTQLLDNQSLDAITLCFIKLSEENLLQYHWDRIVKVFLKWGFTDNDYKRQHYADTVSKIFRTTEHVTDEIAVTIVEQLIKDTNIPVDTLHHHQHAYTYYKPLMKTVELEYSKLFQPSGSQYLCEMLEISASDRLHNYWDTILPVIDAPDTYEAFGRQWSKSMINTIIRSTN